MEIRRQTARKIYSNGLLLLNRPWRFIYPGYRGLYPWDAINKPQTLYINHSLDLDAFKPQTVLPGLFCLPANIQFTIILASRLQNIGDQYIHYNCGPPLYAYFYLIFLWTPHASNKFQGHVDYLFFPAI